MGFLASATSAAILYILALISSFSRSGHVSALAGSEIAVNATPTLLVGSVLPRDVRCARVTVSGLSRLRLESYSSAHRITLVPSYEIHKKSYRKIQICLHSNASLGLCQCENGYWENIPSGIWNYVVSPYEERYIDVKFVENLSGFVTVSVKLEFHKWRLFCLAIGFVLLLLAPIVSSWVPFYYSSSMAIGVCLVVIVLLFQGMKLFPTGRKNALYTTLCGLAVGAGSFLLNRFSDFVNSILANFGISEEMHNPVLVFLLVGIVLAGAGFGYWFVRKFVVAEDGIVDVGVAQFVKWALRVVGATFIFQSTLDTPLAVAMLFSLPATYYLLTSLKWHGIGNLGYTGGGIPPKWRSVREYKNNRAEFLRMSGPRISRRSLWRSPNTPPASSNKNSPVHGDITPSSLRNRPMKPRGTPSTLSGTTEGREYYSSFHTTPNRKKFSEEEWKDFTEESTRQALTEWASSPEFTYWMMNHAGRIQLKSEVSSGDESIRSGSDSTDDNAAQSSSGRGLVYRRHY